MKNYILGILMMFSITATQAHTIGPVLCGTSGKVKISGTAFDYDGNGHPSYVLLYITTNGISTGTKKWQGKAYITNAGNFSMDTVPFFSTSTSDRKVFWVQYQWIAGSYQATLWNGSVTIQTACTPMPITFKSLTVTQVESGDYPAFKVSWSFADASQIATFTVKVSDDGGKTYQNLVVEKADVNETTGEHVQIVRVKRVK